MAEPKPIPAITCQNKSFGEKNQQQQTNKTNKHKNNSSFCIVKEPPGTELLFHEIRIHSKSNQT
jgi:hypothetical protein